MYCSIKTHIGRKLGEASQKEKQRNCIITLYICWTASNFPNVGNYTEIYDYYYANYIAQLCPHEGELVIRNKMYLSYTAVDSQLEITYFVQPYEWNLFLFLT